jgi:hypothetical protein
MLLVGKQVLKTYGVRKTMEHWCEQAEVEYVHHRTASEDVQNWILDALKERGTAYRNRMLLKTGATLNIALNRGEEDPELPYWEGLYLRDKYASSPLLLPE